MQEFSFGERVRITKQYSIRNKGMEKRYFDVPRFDTGIFLGWRDIHDWKTVCNMNNDYSVIRGENHRAAFVALNDKNNPIYIPRDGIYKIK